MEDFTVLQAAFRWSKPHRGRKGRHLQVCVEEKAVWKGHVWRSTQHNCTRLIRMANIMLYSTCSKKNQSSDWPFNNSAVWVLGNGRSFFWGCFKQHPLSTLDVSPTESCETMQSRDCSYLYFIGKRVKGIFSAKMQWQFEMFRCESKTKVKS